MIKTSLCFIARHVIKAYGGVKHTSKYLHCNSYELNESECSVAEDTAIRVFFFLSQRTVCTKDREIIFLMKY
jgi:hypothetical protein